MFNKLAFLGCFLFFSSAFANCELYRFQWDCEMLASPKKFQRGHSLVYCGNVPLYVSEYTYDQIVRYQRADVNLVVTLNDEYITSPCIPAGRKGSN